MQSFSASSRGEYTGFQDIRYFPKRSKIFIEFYEFPFVTGVFLGQWWHACFLLETPMLGLFYKNVQQIL